MRKFQQLTKVNLLAEELQHHDFMSIVGETWKIRGKKQQSWLSLVIRQIGR